LRSTGDFAVAQGELADEALLAGELATCGVGETEIAGTQFPNGNIGGRADR